MKNSNLLRRLSGKFSNRDRKIVLSEFDHEHYQSQLIDSKIEVKIDLVDHYLSIGWLQNLNPCPWFNTKAYLSANKDVKNAGTNPFVHYLTYGLKENRLPNPQPMSDQLDLLEQYRDLFLSAGYSIQRKTGHISITGKNLVIKGVADNTIWTAADVLCKQDYYFHIHEDCLMFDIGCNLAMTSLLFATNPRVKHIVGYEPFIPTFKQAQRNLKLNPFLAKKIKLHNYGLGSTAETKSIHYNSELPGAMSTVTDSFIADGQLEQVVIKNVSVELQSVIEKNPFLKIFVKLDAEGAEYDIIRDLDKSNILKKIDVVIIEWHHGDQQTLIDTLTRNGMFVFCSQTIPNKQGIIRAVRL